MRKAILFDVDGLIADSERLGISIFEFVMRKHGINLSEKEKQKFIGVTDEKVYKDILKSRNANLDINKLLNEHFEIYEKKLLNVKILPGATECVARLRGRYKLGVVSGSTLKQVNIILKKAKIENYFDVKVTCETYEKSKPNPEPYLIAANKLNVKPQECVAIEDAPTGILSGKKAGMIVVGVKVGNQGRLDLSTADKVVETLNEIDIYLIEQL